ncbi:L-threonylcarbamoyladenylate synthase [Microvirga sp. W0021]|uniref:Threonylcarbamoyl-AMP synthase n=1 Tax=Hohaiivirga grylli TaxID=3133970 RepID=A0ABV0BGY7_9HYPH
MNPTEYLQADEIGLQRAAELLAQGLCVAFPTETVYGLGADATSPKAVADIYSAKQRPSFNPLIAHLPSAEMAFEQGVFSEDAKALATAFWPGPLTLVVPISATSTVCDLARAGLTSVGLRVPDHPVAKAILEKVALPIAAPSANSSGHVSATSAPHVLEDLNGRIAAVVDGGSTNVGVESTIIDCTGTEPGLLRPGGITREQIEAVLGKKLAHRPPVSAKPMAPGMLTSHYAPLTGVRLNATSFGPREAALLFGKDFQAPDALISFNLSESGDLAEAAGNLFSALRTLDEAGADCIAISPIPNSGLGEAINDRLSRAAADKTA